MIASNLPYRLWLLNYNQKHLRFSHFSVSRPLHLPTIISFDLSGVFRPIECADSNHDVHLAIPYLVVEQRIKTSPIFAILKHRHLLPPTTIRLPTLGVSRPILRADSNDVHSTIASLAVEQKIKTSLIFTIFSVLSVPSSASPSASPNYNQLRSKRCF